MRLIISTSTLLLLVFQIHNAVAYSIPQKAVLPLARASAIDVTRNGFTYGPSVGGGPFYPVGTLGLAKNSADVTAEGIESAAELALTTADQVAAAAGKVSPYSLFNSSGIN